MGLANRYLAGVFLVLFLSGCTTQFCSDTSLCKNGEPWWPLAQNVAWIEETDSHDYSYYLQRLSDSGVDLVRIVLVPWDLHEEWEGVGQYDPARLDELRSVLELADELDMKVILTLDIYGELKTESDDSREMLWESNPYNAITGGMLDLPEEFFTDRRARRAYKQRLQNLVTSVGEYDSLYAWELWNEVDVTTDYDAEAVCGWHKEMSSYLRRNDARNRYITTSFADFRNGDCVWKLNNIDIVTVHYYGEDVVERIPELYAEASIYGKPVILEEYAWGTEPGLDNEAIDGKHIRDAIAGAREAGFAAAPMIWWWDSYVEQQNLYSAYSSWG